MASVKPGHQSFTFEYKLKVIAHADEIGNQAAAREFEIEESMIHDLLFLGAGYLLVQVI